MSDEKRLISIDQAALNEIARKHAMFRTARLGGARASLARHDLSYLNLVGQDFSHADFTGAVLYQADMHEATLDYAVLFAADLRQANMHSVSLVRADMRGACLRGTSLINADMTGVDLREGSIANREGKMITFGEAKHPSDNGGVDLSGANLSLAKLSGAVAINGDFSDTTMRGVRIVRANLQGAKFEGANLEDADLSLCDLREANLNGAVLVNATMSLANLTDATLAGALTNKPIGPTIKDLPMPLSDMLRSHAAWLASNGKEGQRFDITGYDLRRSAVFARATLTLMRGVGAMLYAMDFSDAQLQSADLREADLRHANFMAADMRGCDLNKAKLNNAGMQGVQLQPLVLNEGRAIATDLSGAALRYVNFSGASLRQVNFRNADLSYANLQGCDLTDADLTGATLEGARLSPSQQEMLKDIIGNGH